MKPIDEHAVVPASEVAEDTTGFLRNIPLPLDEPVPTRIGGYRILRIVGQGGMGTVYEAEQESTRRFVAIKVIHPHLATARYRRRFAEEIRTLGRFEHPGIARIHEAGSAPDDQGALRLYFAMELVKGLRVDEHTASLALNSSAIASLMASICDAVHHAHQKGVIHCDLKPANIVVAPDGTPKILDFGIARILGDEARELSAVSHPGDHAAIIGTLAFASPEQAIGDRNRLDVLTDVYGLGAVLYALLTRRPPHDVSGCSLPEAARIVRDIQPKRARAWQPRCPADLETIVAKAIAPMSDERYDSAAALASELRRFVQGRPIQARPSPWYEVASKLMRRNRLATALIAVTLVALAAWGISLGAVMAQRAAIMAQRDTEAKRVLAEQKDHNGTRTSVQGSLLSMDARHRRSTVLMEHLAADEMPGYRGRVLAALPWTAQMFAGLAPGQLVTLDDQGDTVDCLDGFRAWPVWARPRFDAARRFARGVGDQQKSDTLVATLCNCDDDAARELVRGLKIQNDHLHLAVLEIDDVSAVVAAAGGAPTQLTSQLWSHGDFMHVVFDNSSRLLWSLSIGEELPFYVSELAAWDSARCPGGSDAPRLLTALDTTNTQGVHGVLPPLAGDAEHPPVRPRWAFTTLPPKSMRGSGTQRSNSRQSRAESELARGVTRIQIQSFEPYPASEQRGLGRLFVAFRKADIPRDAIASVEVGAHGEFRGPFCPEVIQDLQADQRARAFAAQLAPAEVIKILDLAAISGAIPIAEQALREHATDIDALAAIAGKRQLSREQRVTIEGCIRAMTSNWRWLLNAAAESLERPEIISRLGEALDGPTAAEVVVALARIEHAGTLHNNRCPDNGGGTCVCEWFIEHERAVALCAAGDWPECAEAASRAIALHDGQTMLGFENPADHAIHAIALHALGHQQEAAIALSTAEQQTLDMAARTTKDHQGSVDELRPRLLARARALIRER